MAFEEPRKTGMQYRRLGNSGLHVSVLGLGGWITLVLLSRDSIGCHWLLKIGDRLTRFHLGTDSVDRMRSVRSLEHLFWVTAWSRPGDAKQQTLTEKPSPTESTTACLKQAYDLGINFFDTAEKYGTFLH